MEVLKQSHTECFHVDNLVTKANKDGYLKFVTDSYQDWIKESHLQRYGAIPALNVSQYHPYFTKLSNGTFAEDTEDREFFIASWQFSPPPIT